jgi:hypothetical protein
MNYKLSDQVSMRLVQIFQEAVILGVDGADLLRQVRVVFDPAEADTLVLDPSYLRMVEDHHSRLLEELTQRKDAQQLNLFEQDSVTST